MKMLPNNLSNNLSTMCKMRIFSQATNNNISGIFVLTKKVDAKRDISHNDTHQKIRL